MAQLWQASDKTTQAAIVMLGVRRTHLEGRDALPVVGQRLGIWGREEGGNKGGREGRMEDWRVHMG